MSFWKQFQPGRGSHRRDRGSGSAVPEMTRGSRMAPAQLYLIQQIFGGLPSPWSHVLKETRAKREVLGPSRLQGVCYCTFLRCAVSGHNLPRTTSALRTTHCATLCSIVGDAGIANVVPPTVHPLYCVAEGSVNASLATNENHHDTGKRKQTHSCFIRRYYSGPNSNYLPPFSNSTEASIV